MWMIVVLACDKGVFSGSYMKIQMVYLCYDMAGADGSINLG